MLRKDWRQERKTKKARKRRRARSPGVTLCSRWNVQMQMFIQIRQELFLRGCKCTPRTCRGFSSYINIRFRPSVQGLRRTNVRRTFRPCVSIRHARCRRRRTRTAWGEGGRRWRTRFIGPSTQHHRERNANVAFRNVTAVEADPILLGDRQSKRPFRFRLLRSVRLISAGRVIGPEQHPVTGASLRFFADRSHN